MENTVLSIKDLDLESNLEEFICLAQKLANIVSAHTPLRATSPDALDRLKNLPLSKIQTHCKNLKLNISALEIVPEEKSSNRDVIKSILHYMRLSTSQEFLDKVSENDIVEVYNLEGIQIFRNLKFYETTAYSLSDLLAYEWPDLYYRSSKITEKIFTFIDKVMKDPSNNAVYEMTEIPVHMIKEIKADPIQLCEIRLKNMAPIINSFGEKTGFIVSCEARSMKATMEHHELSFI